MFPQHTVESAPLEAQPLLSGVKARFGFIPNVYANLAEAPVALEALLQITALFGRTSLTDRERHLLYLTSSVEQRCNFCVAAHTRGAIAGNVGAEAIDAIRAGELPTVAREAAFVTFVRAMIRSRGFVTEGELRDFFAHGFAHRHALEAVLGVSMKILTHYVNHMTKTELNPELAEFAWSAP